MAVRRAGTGVVPVTAMSEAAFLWSWEADAMADREMPEGLSLADQSAYTAIRNIYAAHRAGRLSREAGAAEKRRVKRRYDLEMGEREQERKLALHRAQVIRLTEQAATAVRKDPSPENALRLVDVLDGIEREWKDEV